MASRFFHVDEDHNVLSVQGDLDVYSVAVAIKEGCELINSTGTATVIDLSRVEKIDSAGLAFVIELMKIAKKSGKKLHFQNIPARMKAVADVYGLSDIVPGDAFQSA